MKGIFLFIAVAVLAPEMGFAIDFKQAKFTEVINDVKIISANQVAPAAVNNVFEMPDVLRTGPGSRAELVGADDTITRVGANTIFSFDPAERTIDLQQGSLLFHSPHGKGGGTIHTATATASVLGTTLIASTTPDGGLKILDLEGSVKIKFLNGLEQHLEPGQMTFVLPGGAQRAPIILFRLDQQTRTSALVKGFAKPLASLPLINKQIANQLKLIQSGHAVDTDLMVGAVANANQVQVAFDTEPGNPDNLNGNQNVPNPYQAPADIALTEDVTINGPLLPPNHTFPTYDISGNTFLADDIGNPYHGFDANNITIDTPTIDLSAYAGDALGPYFDIAAMGTIDIEGSGVTFTGLGPADKLYLSAGSQLLIAPGATVVANTGLFQLSAQDAISLSGVSLENNVGNLGLYSLGEISLLAGSSVSAAGLVEIGYDTVEDAPAVDVDSSAITAGSIDLEAVDSVTINNSTLTASSGDIDISTEDNTIDLEGSAINAAGTVDISSGGALTMGATTADTIQADGGVDISSDGAMDLEQSTITAAGGVDISSYDTLTMGATTADTIQAGAEVDIFSDGAMDLERSTITAVGNVYLFSYSSLTMGASIADTIQAGAGATVEAYGNITDYSTPINETGGDGIDIYSYDGSLDVENANLTTTGSGDINITSSGPLELGVYQNLSSYAASQTFTGSDVNIQSTGDAVSIYTTSINASDDINVNSVGTLTVDALLGLSETPDTFTAGNDISLTSSGGDVDLYDTTTLTTTYGSVSVSAEGTVDVDDVTINAANGISLESSPVPTSLVPSPTGDVDVEDSATLTAASGDLDLTANAGVVNLSDSTLTADSGSIDISAEGTEAAEGMVNINDMTISAANSAGATVTLSGVNGVTISDSTITTDPVNGTVNINSSSSTGTITVENSSPAQTTTIQAGMLTLNSGDGILLDGSTGTLNLNSSGGSMNLTVNQSGGLISVYDVNLTGYGSINMSAHTLVLQDVTFALTSAVTLDSFNGVAHFNSVAPGDVNFISGVYDGSTLINNQTALNGASNITIGHSPN